MATEVTVGGRQYKLDGIPFGRVPVFQMVHHANGQALTAAEFSALPEADQAQLAQAVQAYVDRLNGKA